MKKRDFIPARLKRAKKELVELSHTFIRKRDSKDPDFIGGNCFDCGKYTEGRDFQCGHFVPNSVGGALLRYHPLNMNGQASSCNVWFTQEMVKINYTGAMVRKYGQKRVDELLGLKNRTVKADIIFYETLLELYKEGIEDKIIAFLEK